MKNTCLIVINFFSSLLIAEVGFVLTVISTRNSLGIVPYHLICTDVRTCVCLFAAWH